MFASCVHCAAACSRSSPPVSLFFLPHSELVQLQNNHEQQPTTLNHRKPVVTSPASKRLVIIEKAASVDCLELSRGARRSGGRNRTTNDAGSTADDSRAVRRASRVHAYVSACRWRWCNIIAAPQCSLGCRCTVHFPQYSCLLLHSHV